MNCCLGGKATNLRWKYSCSLDSPGTGCEAFQYLSGSIEHWFGQPIWDYGIADHWWYWTVLHIIGSYLPWPGWVSHTRRHGWPVTQECIDGRGKSVWISESLSTTPLCLLDYCHVLHKCMLGNITVPSWVLWWRRSAVYEWDEFLSWCVLC